MSTLQRISDLTLHSHGGKRKFSMDITLKKNGKAKPVILFIHGFKGFKDWGPFPLMADFMAERGYIFVKFNFSHNGTTLEDSMNFTDLEAFGKNRFSYELQEMGQVLDFIQSKEFPVSAEEMNRSLFLMGHSRGGSVSIAKTHEEPRIKALATLAAVGNLSAWAKDLEAEWEKNGVIYIYNQRTHQEMPLYYSLAEDYKENESRLNIPEIAPRIKVPWLIVHGDADETVPVIQAKVLHQLNPASELLIMEGASHTFGAGHPHEGNSLPGDFRKALEAVDGFFRDIITDC